MEYWYLDAARIDDFHAGSKAKTDADKIFLLNGCKSLLGNKQITPTKSKIGKMLSFLKIKRKIKAIKNKDLLFVQYPLSNYLYNDIDRAMAKNNNIVLLIHDINGLREQSAELQHKEVNFFKKAKFIISHNGKMSDYLINNGVDKSKIIELGLFDYLAEVTVQEPKKNNLCFAGNLGKSVFLNNLPEDLRNLGVGLYGIGHENLKLLNGVEFCGVYGADIIPAKLTGKFGLVWDGDCCETCNGKNGEYLKWNCPHKASLYISAGIPIVVWTNSAIADFVIKNNLGIAVDSLLKLGDIMQNVSEADYLKMQSNVLNLSKIITNGGHLSKAIEDIKVKCQA